jgi:RNA polymerase sigma factor (sigma-70 family)
MDQLVTKRLLHTNLNILIQGCRQHDLQCQQQLYRLCYPDMIKVCFRYAHDADGAGIIYNDAMLKVFRNLGSYTEAGKLMAWVKTIVVHTAIDFCKKKNIFNQSVPYFTENDEGLRPEALDRISGKEIQAWIAELPSATGTVFNMYVYDGFTHKQIGERLGISEGTSKWHVSEAKKRLKKKLELIAQTELKANAAG